MDDDGDVTETSLKVDRSSGVSVHFSEIEQDDLSRESSTMWRLTDTIRGVNRYAGKKPREPVGHRATVAMKPDEAHLRCTLIPAPKKRCRRATASVMPATAASVGIDQPSVLNGRTASPQECRAPEPVRTPTA